MVKCGACGKFLSPSECARCTKCSAAFHKACVGLPNNVLVTNSWVCPECKTKIPRQDNTSTPVRGMAAACRAPGSPAHLDDTAVNVTEEFKLDWALELRSFRNDLKATRDEIHQCRLEISEFKAALSAFDVKMSDMESRLSKLENQYEGLNPPNIASYEATIAELKSQLNSRDQEALLNDIEITGVPEQRGENVVNILATLSAKLAMSFEEKDVVYMERIGSVRRNRVEGSTAGSAAGDGADGSGVQRPRTIAVRFTRRATRDNWLRAARVRRNLTTADVVSGASGKPGNIYINERLSYFNRQLFYRARQAGKKYNWKYVWSRDGRTLARKEDGQGVVLIRNDSDLSKFF